MLPRVFVDIKNFKQGQILKQLSSIIDDVCRKTGAKSIDLLCTESIHRNEEFMSALTKLMPSDPAVRKINSVTVSVQAAFEEALAGRCHMHVNYTALNKNSFVYGLSKESKPESVATRSMKLRSDDKLLRSGKKL